MKSKAQEFVDSINHPPIIEFDSDRCAIVNNDGAFYISCNHLSPKGALKLRDWLTDTFDVPKED